MSNLENADIRGQRNDAEVNGAEETVNEERRTLLKALGATLALMATGEGCLAKEETNEPDDAKPCAGVEPEKRITVPQEMIEEAKKTGGIDLSYTDVNDISNLRGLKLWNVSIKRTKIADITPLTGMPIEYLDISHSNVTDISPIRGMPILHINFQGTEVEDTSPLNDIKIVPQVDYDEISIEPNGADIDIKKLLNHPLIRCDNKNKKIGICIDRDFYDNPYYPCDDYNKP